MKKFSFLFLVLLISGCQGVSSNSSINTSSSSSTEVSSTTINSNTSSTIVSSSPITSSSTLESTTSISTSSSSLSQSSSNSTTVTNNSSSSSSIEEVYDDGLKQGLSGKEWLDYYSKEDVMACESIPSTGTSNILVVPVLFKNESLNNSSKVLNEVTSPVFKPICLPLSTPLENTSSSGLHILKNAASCQPSVLPAFCGSTQPIIQ